MLTDTNILVYAINKNSPKHIRAKEFLEDNINNLTVAHQNIIEAVKVLTQPKFIRPMKSKDAIEAILAIAENCQIIFPKSGTEFITLELIKKLNLVGNRIFDAYLAATALINGIDTIATDNVKDFSKITQIKVTNPFS